MSSRLSQFAIVFLGVMLLASGFLLGTLWAERDAVANATTEAATRAVPIALENSEIPVRDVTGDDIADLPRYPGAVRVEYRYVLVNDLAETELEYVVAANLEDVHEYYREVFDEQGWVVADLGIYQGEWTFLIVSGEREAIVELEARLSLVEIEIELSEPVSS